MTTGRALSRSLSEKRAEVERRLRSVSSEYEKVEEQLGQVLTAEARLWSEFAAVQIAEASALPRQIEALLDDRRRKIEARSRAVSEAEGRVQALSSERRKLAEADEEARTALEEARRKAAAAFEEDDEATALRVDLTNLAEAAEGLASKYARAVGEREEKRGGFEADEIFAYLQGRGFGTQAYRAWGPVARIDSWIANLSDHRRKVAEHARLLDIPRWIHSRLEAAEATRDAKARDVEEARRRHYGHCAPLEERAASASKALAEVDSLIEAEEAKIHEGTSYIAEAARATDEEMRKATKAFAAILSKKGLRDLKNAAALTVSARDDEIVHDLEELAARRSDLEARAASLRPGLGEFQKRAKAIDEVERKLRSRGWTGSDDRFSSRVGAEHVNQLGDGLITAAALWSMIQGAHRPPAATSGGYSSGSGWSSGSSGGGFGGDSSGGFGGGSWSSGGGFGGGGSDTGGGF